jgi:hypothetical protein
MRKKKEPSETAGIEWTSIALDLILIKPAL